MALPPTFAASALYDHLLQHALRQFFDRATFETESVPSESSLGRLAIEPTPDPSALTIRWFGSRHTLHVPARRPFTPHEVRLARAIGEVLAARYRAIFEPRLMAERGDLFRGWIEDRYVGAFVQGGDYTIEMGESRADRIATAIEVLRVAALSSYENRPISSGVLIVGDADRPASGAALGPVPYTPALAAVKSVFRLCDGVRTLFLVDPAGLVRDVVDIERWAETRGRPVGAEAPCATPYRAHARATHGTGDVCIVLSPTHEIKVFAEGAQLFTFRHAGWHLLDLQAKYDMWRAAVGDEAIASRLFEVALDLAEARRGALFVLLRDPADAAPQLIAPADRLDVRLGTRRPEPDAPERAAAWRRDLLQLLVNRSVTELDRTVVEALGAMDGATVMDLKGRIIATGAILLHPTVPGGPDLAVEGARTTAAVAAARFGPVLKVSEDGVITFYDGDKIWDI
jgi:hypothetical protein